MNRKRAIQAIRAAYYQTPEHGKSVIYRLAEEFARVQEAIYIRGEDVWSVNFRSNTLIVLEQFSWYVTDEKANAHIQDDVTGVEIWQRAQNGKSKSVVRVVMFNDMNELRWIVNALRVAEVFDRDIGALVKKCGIGTSVSEDTRFYDRKNNKTMRYDENGAWHIEPGRKLFLRSKEE